MRNRITLIFGSLLIATMLLAYLPAAETKGDPKAGRGLHAKYCQRCHGESGKGDGPATRTIKAMKMADWTNREEMAKYGDDELYKITSEGGAAAGKSKLMPAFKEKLKEKEIWDLVAFIRSMSQK